MINEIYQMILFGAALAVLSILASPLSRRLGAPSLLVFLLLGMLAGEDGPGGIRFNDFDTAFLFGNIALAVILLDGGLRTQLETFRVGFGPALSLATVGVLLTAGCVGVAASWVLGWPLLEGFLVGAIVGSTDAAAVFGLLHAAGLELKQRSGATLEIESGINDPAAIFLTVILVTALAGSGTVSGWMSAWQFAQQMGLGLAIGLAGGYMLTQLCNRLSLPLALYSLLVIAAGLGFFSVANLAGGSGFLAIYVTGLVLANSALTHVHDIRRFHDGMAWLSQIGMFLMLGLLVTPSHLLDVAYPGLIVALVLIFVARPVAVILCLSPFRFPWQEQLFISWVGLRGAVPIILALFPYLSGLEHSDVYFELTFFVVLLSLCLQGWTIAPLARWLQIELPPRQEDLQRLGLGIPGYPGTELVAYRVHAGSAAEAYEVDKLPLGAETRLLGVIRQNEVLGADRAATLQPDDHLVLLTRVNDIAELSPLFTRLPAPSHLVANEFFGQFSLKPDIRLDDLAAVYGVPVPAGAGALTIADLIAKRYHGKPVVGDRVRLGGVELVVRRTVGRKIVQIGLKILPASAGAPG